MYVKQPIEAAVREALNVLGNPSAEWKKPPSPIDGQQWEIDEAIYTLRASLGLPVPQNICDVCNARDEIYWRRGSEHDRPWCHNCGTVAPQSHWVTEPLPDSGGEHDG